MKRFGNGARNSDSNMPISNARKRPLIADKWYLDEVVVTIKKQQYYLWQAVDSEGNVLDVLLQRHRDTKAANRFFRKLLKKQGFVPRVMVTDKLKSYAAAKKQVLKNVEHRQHKRVNNRHERESDGCGSSNLQGKHSDFYLHLNQFAITSIPNNIT